MYNLYEYFENLYKSDKMGHAFLIGNVSFDKIKDEIEKILSDFLFNYEINVDNNPDVYIVMPENGSISKLQIKSLLNKLSTTSQFNNKKVYIMTDVESLSDSVYNALLKTIEEPSNDIYAFLITSNLNGVGDTIKSRCQNIFVSSLEINKNNELLSSLAEEIVLNIEKYGIDTYSKYSEIYKKIENKIMLKDLLYIIYDIYMDMLYNKTKINLKKMILNDDIELISKKILFINSLIEKNNININKDLVIDELINGIWRCNSEANLC